jgi:hypothetical protein
MSDDARTDDSDRLAILARRKRWVTLAIAGATAAATATACACLSPALDGGPPPHDAGPDTSDPDAP